MKFVWTTVLCWILGYTRPEFFVSFLISFSIVIILFIFEKRYTNAINYLGLILPTILVIFGLFFLGGQPLGNRGIDAFKQHFVLNYLSWHPTIHLESKDRSEFIFFQKIYGDVNSMTDIFTKNPPLFFKHIYFNLINYLKLSESLLFHFCFDPLIKIFSSKTKYVTIGGFSFLLLLINVRATISFFKESIKKYIRTNGLITLVILLPSFVSVILIYPREHYFLFHLVVKLSIITLVLDSLVFKKSWIIPFLKIGVLSLFMVGCSLNQLRTKENRNYAEMFHYIMKLSQKHKLALVSNEVFSPIFFKEKLAKYYISIDNEKGRNIDDYLKNFQVNIIYLDIKSINPANPFLVSFVERNYQSYGFIKITTYQKLNYLIFVKKGIE